MDESNLGIIDQSIGSMLGVLKDLTQSQSIFGDIPIKNLQQETNKYQSTTLKEHQIQLYQFKFDEQTYTQCLDIIQSKFQYADNVIELQKQINSIFLHQYHNYEKQIINQVKNLSKDDIPTSEYLEDQVIEWHAQLTSTFNTLSSLKLFNRDDNLVWYNEEIFTSLANDPNLQQYQIGAFNNCSDAVSKYFNQYKQEITLQSSQDYKQIVNNLQVLKKYESQQQFINLLIDLLNAKLIYDISQIVKNSLNNIDKITNYLAHIAIRNQMNQLRQRQEKSESAIIHSTCRVTINKIKYLSYPKTQQEQQDIYKQFNDINTQLNKVIQQNIKTSYYPRCIKKILQKIFEYFFRGYRKLIKIRVRYYDIAKKFEDTIDKESLLSPLVLIEIQKLQRKVNRITNFMSGLFEFGLYCSQCYVLSEEVDSLVFQMSVLEHHYTELLRIVGQKIHDKDQYGRRPDKKKIFEPYPEIDRQIINKKYQLNSTLQSLNNSKNSQH